MLRSKGRNKLFDEKGVFGRVCRHEYPKGFISMKHGERIAYSVFEVDRLLQDANPTINVKIMYDIGCTLSAHLKKNNRQDILDRIDLAIPVFHCYGHKSSCQIEFGPRRKEGYGLTDGEGIERLWSYLRGFSSITKEMTCGRRVDVLTDALLHYAQKRLQQFGPSLISNLQKAKNLMENARLQLHEICSNLTVEYDESLVKSWIEEEQNVLLAREKAKVLPLSWGAKYVQNLFQLEELRHNIAATESDKYDSITDLVKKRKSTLKAIVSTERTQKIKQRWKFGEARFNSAALTVEKARRDRAIERLYALSTERMFLLSLKRKYADGQAIAAKLSKQITQKSNTIKVFVEKYNAVLTSWKERVDGMPEALKFDDVKDPESKIFSDFKTNSSSQDSVPFSEKRNVIDLYHLIERCKEEVSYLNLEMVRLVTYHKNRVSILETFPASHVDETSVYVKGVNCAVRKQIREENNKLHALGSILSDNLPIEMQSSLPQFQCKIQATKPLNELSPKVPTDNEEHEMVYSDSDNINEEEYEEQLDLVLDLSDDE